MAVKTQSLEKKSLDSPDETRDLSGMGTVDIVKIGESKATRSTFKPGWRWSQHVKPIANTDSCQTAHLGYVLSGRMHIVMDDGTEGECGAGDAVHIAPGHDAWTVAADRR